MLPVSSNSANPNSGASINNNNSRSPMLTLSAGTAASVAMAAAASLISQNAANKLNNITSEESGKGPATSPTGNLDKTEINEAVTKVLEGYDWTLVPIATK